LLDFNLWKRSHHDWLNGPKFLLTTLFEGERVGLPGDFSYFLKNKTHARIMNQQISFIVTTSRLITWYLSKYY
jgi:hypothetical protein